MQHLVILAFPRVPLVFMSLALDADPTIRHQPDLQQICHQLTKQFPISAEKIFQTYLVEIRGIVDVPAWGPSEMAAAIAVLLSTHTHLKKMLVK